MNCNNTTSAGALQLSLPKCFLHNNTQTTLEPFEVIVTRFGITCNYHPADDS